MSVMSAATMVVVPDADGQHEQIVQNVVDGGLKTLDPKLNRRTSDPQICTENILEGVVDVENILKNQSRVVAEQNGEKMQDSNTLKSAQEDVALSGQNHLLGRAFIMRVSLLGQKYFFCFKALNIHRDISTGHLQVFRSFVWLRALENSIVAILN